MAAGSHPPAWTRLLRRLWRPFLTASEKRRVSDAVAEAERRTTGVIRVHVIGRSGREDLLALARETFHELGLEKTPGRNAVLILISHLDHRFAIYGDQAIHDRAGSHLWDRAARTLREHFEQRRYAVGVEACVAEVGAELARQFPRAAATGSGGESGK